MKSDIVCLSETHAIKKDVLKFEGYKCYSSCRPEETNKPSGGLAVFISKWLVTGIKVIDNSHSDIMWLKLDKNFFHFSKDLFCCFVYISPINSCYTKRTGCDKIIFDKLESDISKYSILGDVMLLGDMNAHIKATELDFIKSDSDIYLDDFLPNNYTADAVQRNRNTEVCQSTNEYGKSVIDLCNESQLRILNGRTIGDTKGKATLFSYNGVAITDYCICSANFLSNIVNFTVDSLNPVLSDHCPITVNLIQYRDRVTSSGLLQPKRKQLKWDASKELLFKANIQNIEFDNISKEIKEVLDLGKVNPKDLNCNIDKYIDSLSTSLYNAAFVSNRKNVSMRKGKRSRKKKKPWIDSECENNYKNIKNLSRSLRNNPWDNHLRLKVYSEKKKFNKLCRKKHRLYRNKIINQIVEASEENNSSEFWDSIKRLSNKKTDPSSNISHQDWLTHFRDLMNVNYVHNLNRSVPDNKELLDLGVLNSEITAEEVLKAVKSLKNNKASGTDGIKNEMLKISCLSNVELYVNLFNLVLKSEVYPGAWRNNYIKPIFKGGCFNDPSHYRGVAISSCFGKFFAKVLNNRLDIFLENHDILSKVQIGFKKKCRTSDHILTLKTLIDRAFRSAKRLYTCFVDLKKAFDTVNRQALMYKLHCCGVEGSFLNIIRSMYQEVNYALKLEEGETEFFSSKVGVKQGCILSPTLFSLYINDFYDCVDCNLCDAPTLENVKVPCLLYADDIVLVSETEKGLQKSLDTLQDYCNSWDLQVNVEKTKIIVFNKSGRVFKNIHFSYGDKRLECTNEYKYLGIIFKPSGSFANAVEHLCKRANKALFSIRKSLFSPYMNVKAHLKLFDSCIKPILLYCSEIWAPDLLVKVNSTLEDKFLIFPPVKTQLKFAKYILGVGKKAVNLAVLSELGLMPVAIDALKLSVGFWLHVINSQNNLLVNKAYTENMKLTNSFTSKMEQVFKKAGFHSVWLNQNTFSKKRLLFSFQKRLQEKFVSFWKNSIFMDENKPNKNKLRTYRDLKSDFSLEKFLLLDLQKDIISNYVRIRISNSKLLIEQGRHQNIPLENRICSYCNSDVENEFHFIMKCKDFEHLRTKLFSDITDIIPGFRDLSDIEKFNFIMSSNDYDVMKVCITGVNDMYSKRKLRK